MGGIVLHNFDLDQNCYKVRLGLAMLGLEWRTVAVDAFPGAEQKSPRYLALNPLGTLPILEDGDLVLNGAEPVLAHLAAAHDPARRWLPHGGPDFARVMQWLHFAFGDLSKAATARDQSLFDAAGPEAATRAAARRCLRVMEDHMTARGFAGALWFAADNPTIADIALFPAFALSRDYGVDHDEYPALRRWARRFRALPGFLTMPGIPDYH